MATTDDVILKGEAALTALYNLQKAAMKKGDLATQKALADDIDDLTYKLTQLQSLQVAADDEQIQALNNKLDAVTDSAKKSLARLNNITTVLGNVVAGAKLLDSVITAAMKA